MSAGENRWLLPDGFEELWPDEAWRLESMRRGFLDLCRARGYALASPPLVEYLDSLSAGVGLDLEQATFKLVDPQSGKLLGLRADITPQAARLDAHLLREPGATRLCYAGPVVRTRPDGFGGARELLQAGAELFGDPTPEADFETIALMAESLRAAGIPTFHLDLGHVGIYRALVAEMALPPEQERALFEALRRKSRPEVEAIVPALELPGPLREALLRLPSLNGDHRLVEAARPVFAGCGPAVQDALDNLAAVAGRVRSQLPQVPLFVDIAELRGYAYHSGAVFAAYVPGHGQAIAQGGRYDDIGRVFGRARAATGFSADLRQWLRIAPPPGGGPGAKGN
jgi:ATP phosphoribosyltransferase regulatory subunit